VICHNKVDPLDHDTGQIYMHTLFQLFFYSYTYVHRAYMHCSCEEKRYFLPFKILILYGYFAQIWLLLDFTQNCEKEMF
jgi:hypothetical protein